jgi:sugar phosphate isomerase/epimerase
VKWIKHVHLNDMPDIPADLAHRDFDRVLPGEGVLDLPEIIAALEKSGYEGYFSIEMFSAKLWRLSAKEAARRCYESLLPLCEQEGG